MEWNRWQGWTADEYEVGAKKDKSKKGDKADG